MKKSRKLAFVLTLALVFSCFGSITSFAFDNGYKWATEYTTTVDDYLSSATETAWYEFTLTADEVPTPYSVSLKTSGSCIYNFELWYRSGSSGRPSAVSNETIVARNGSRNMSGVLTEPGTYFVKVYFQSGTVSTLNTYRLKITYGKNSTINFIYDSSLPKDAGGDWVICADIMGNYTYNSIIKNTSTNRTFENAYTFVDTNYSSDSAGGYSDEIKGTPEQTAIAANYIYSGGLMSKPKFIAETNKVYSLTELMNKLYYLDEPVIFYSNHKDSNGEITDERYVILSGVSIGQKTLEFYNPSTGKYVTMSYDTFTSTGYKVSSKDMKYTGTNIVNSGLSRPVQAIYN